MKTPISQPFVSYSTSPVIAIFLIFVSLSGSVQCMTMRVFVKNRKEEKNRNFEQMNYTFSCTSSEEK